MDCDRQTTTTNLKSSFKLVCSDTARHTQAATTPRHARRGISSLALKSKCFSLDRRRKKESLYRG